MIKNIHEHSVDISLLQEGGWVIDFGCGVDFNFSKAMIDLGMKVISVDPNPNIKVVPDIPNLFFERAALTINESIDYLTFDIYNDTDAFSSIKTNNDVYFVNKIGSATVSAITINKIMSKYGISQFDVIKLDIEGGEYDFLMTIDYAISKQISTEFHDFRGMNPMFPDNEKYHTELKNNLSQYYNPIKYDKEQHRGIPGPQGVNYWDTLLIIK